MIEYSGAVNRVKHIYNILKNKTKTKTTQTHTHTHTHTQEPHTHPHTQPHTQRKTNKKQNKNKNKCLTFVKFIAWRLTYWINWPFQRYITTFKVTDRRETWNSTSSCDISICNFLLRFLIYSRIRQYSKCFSFLFLMHFFECMKICRLQTGVKMSRSVIFLKPVITRRGVEHTFLVSSRRYLHKRGTYRCIVTFIPTDCNRKKYIHFCRRYYA